MWGDTLGEAQLAVAIEPARGERRWSVGDAVLDERTLDLAVRGEPVQLERKQIDLLLFLLQHAGDVVTEDEILNAVWPGKFVSPNSVSKSISRIRQVLGDHDKSMVATVHGFGYRLTAPVRCEIMSRPQPVAHFDFKAGDRPPLRPLWSLAQQLGIGGNGEAWLVRHDKTREQRVFKFARDEHALTALKREITLFRLLRESLGEQAPIVTLTDWNLEQAPYFIEAEYLAGGSLVQWSERLGGLQQLTLSDRLETIARIADAVASIHAVGVLHKDLKPSNVLVEHVERGPAKIRLGDLGSGSVMDPERLRRLNITRMGFTQTVASLHTSGGTPLYLSPEVRDGKPPTVQADIYALGVMLYQIVVGDFHRALDTGWERDIPDELLRQDIAFAAEGDASRRLADAAELARRLRALEARNRQLVEQRETARKAALALQAVDRAKARKLGLFIAFATLLIGLGVSSWLYFQARESQQRAETEALRAQTVSQFMTDGVFGAIDSGDSPVKNLTVKELLDRASKKLDQLADQPGVAVQVYASLGRSYDALSAGDKELAVKAAQNLDRALALQQELSGDDAAETLDRAAELMSPMYAAGLLPPAMDRFATIAAAGEKRLGSTAPSVLGLKMELGRHRAALGQWAQAASGIESVLNAAGAGSALAPLFVPRAEVALGLVLTDLGRYEDAERHLKSAIEKLSKLGGAGALDVIRAQSRLGALLISVARYPEADSVLEAALLQAKVWEPEHGSKIHTIRVLQGRLALEQGDIPNGVAILADVEKVGQTLLQPGEKDNSYFRAPLQAWARQQRGKFSEADQIMRLALENSRTENGDRHPTTLTIRVGLADILREQLRPDEAWEVLLGPNPVDYADLPADHPFRADLARVQGLLWTQQGLSSQARPALTESLRINQFFFDDQHWRVRRARSELQLLQPHRETTS
ncbi:MAG: protein kinase domain-containing protein [Panacagrimonas sp.]